MYLVKYTTIAFCVCYAALKYIGNIMFIDAIREMFSQYDEYSNEREEALFLLAHDYKKLEQRYELKEQELDALKKEYDNLAKRYCILEARNTKLIQERDLMLAERAWSMETAHQEPSQSQETQEEEEFCVLQDNIAQANDDFEIVPIFECDHVDLR